MKKDFSKNLILYGLPGSGKTYRAMEYALEITGADHDEDNRSIIFNRLVGQGRIVVCSRIDYGGMMERMSLSGDGTVEDGFFKEMCNRARGSDENYVLIIEDILNIEGEFLEVIREERREGHSSCIPVTLPYSQELFSVPDNVYIIGTINYLERDAFPYSPYSFSWLQVFDFEYIQWDYAWLPVIDGVDMERVVMALNKKVVERNGYYQITPDFFSRARTLDDVLDIFRFQIIPCMATNLMNIYELECLGCTCVKDIADDDGSHFLVKIINICIDGCYHGQIGYYIEASKHPTRKALENIYLEE